MTFIPNPLSEFEQYSYHISFSLADVATGSQSKAGPNQKSLIIAETGKSALYYIEELTLDTIAPVAGNSTTSNIGTGVLTIIEPNGFTLFDRLVTGMMQQGWKQFIDAVYHLEISFNGWLPNGVPVPRVYVSRYRVKVAQVECEQDQMKTTYRFSLLSFTPVALSEESISPHRQFRQEIKKTLQETIKEFERVYNKTAQGIQNSTKYTVGIPDRYVFNLGPKLASLNLKMPVDVESDTTVDQKDGDGKFYFNYQGERIDEALMKLAANAKDIAKEMIPNLRSDGQIDFTKGPTGRLLQFFTFDVDVSYGPFNQELNRYQRIYEYTIDLVPRPDLQELPQNASPQQSHVAALIANGLLSKRYDHYFTGKNTEVLEAKINFNGSYEMYQQAYTNIPTEYGHSITEEGRQNEIGLGPFRKGPLGALLQAFQSVFSSLGFIKNISGFNTNLLETLPLSNALNGFIGGRVIPVDSPEKIVSGVNTVKSPESVTQLGQISFYYAKNTQTFSPLNTITLVIRGDPFWIDNNVGQPSQYNVGTQYLYYYSRTSEPANETTGLPFNIGKIKFEGVYYVDQTKSTFSGGKFTQELSCVIDTNALGIRIAP